MHTRLITDSNLHTEDFSHARFKQLVDLMPQLQDYIQPEVYFDGSVPLIAYHQKSQVSAKNNLFNDYEMPEEKNEEENAEDEAYYPYVK